MRFKFCRGQNIENELIDSTEKEKENEIKNKMKKIEIIMIVKTSRIKLYLKI